MESESKLKGWRDKYMNQQHFEILLAMSLQFAAIYAVTKFLFKVQTLRAERMHANAFHTSEDVAPLDRLSFFLGIGFVGVMGFLEHVIRRAGKFLTQSEWERWRADRPYDKVFVVAAMILALVPLLALWYRLCRNMAPRQSKAAAVVLWLLSVLMAAGFFYLAGVTA
jgi:hypothetical protein